MCKRLVFALFLGLACQSTGEVSQAPTGGSRSSGSGSGGSVMVGPGPVSGTGGTTSGPGPAPNPGPGPGPANMTDAGASSGGGSCPFSMAGTPCSPPGSSCAWNSDCLARRCDCFGNTWACTERQIPCGGSCPAPQFAQCGEPCTGTVSGCLCHCGGGNGPNYGGCSCTQGRWQCTCGGN